MEVGRKAYARLESELTPCLDPRLRWRVLSASFGGCFRWLTLTLTRPRGSLELTKEISRSIATTTKMKVILE